MQLSLPNIVFELIQLVTFPEAPHLRWVDSRKMAGFDITWVEEFETFLRPKLIFCPFFYNLSKIGKQSMCIIKQLANVNFTLTPKSFQRNF